MNINIARQPIFDKNLRVVAYELLYRNNPKENAYSGVDGDFSTVSVIMGTFLNGGFESMTDNKLGFINFTGTLLKNDTVKLLPVKYLVIEILETIEPTEEIFSACNDLKNLGYTIALDDYVHSETVEGFIKYAKIIKMDFLSSTDDQLKDIVKQYKNKGIKFLAEKIETKEDFLKAKKMGYTYFQGYYFCRPALIENKVLLPLQINALQLLGMLQDDNSNINRMAQIIDYDPGMKYNLFRLANSVMYGGRHKIKQTNVAIARIGLSELRTWMLFVIMHGMHMDKPNELIKQSMIRARASEEICLRKRLSSNASGFSILGLFSLLDAIMDAPFKVILSSINIPDNIKNALMDPCDNNGVYCSVLRLLQAYDNADWEEAERVCAHIDLPLEEYGEIYINAIKWCDSMYKTHRIRI